MGHGLCRNAFLNFSVIPDHKGVGGIWTLVERCSYDMGIERVYTVVVDNAPSNQVAIEHIKERIESWGCLVLGWKNLRVVAQMTKVEHKGGFVPMKVCTRWNSTYIISDIAVKYNKEFSKLEDEDQLYGAYFEHEIVGKRRIGPPKKEDWSKAVRFLKICYDATLSFSGTNIKSAHTITTNFW
ncbi:hypothetical protein QQ045_019488 [Rhodiola kirilowii]